jgi:hypothetical protein
LSVPNGHRIHWWLISLLTTVLLAVGGGAVALVKSHAERIAVLESQLMDARQQLVQINQKLDRPRRFPDELRELTPDDNVETILFLASQLPPERVREVIRCLEIELHRPT